MNHKERVVVAMSGGVDSCVAAAVLKEQGYDVIGITMQLWNHASGSGDKRFDSCCSLTDVHDARKAADKIGVPHYLVNYENEFKAGVVDYFANEYAEGRTPNPCVMCNSKLKFDHLIDKARALGARWVATGHYAKIEHAEDRSRLFKGKDPKKDQSYFLFSLKKEYLSKVMFPLSELDKTQVREMAERYGLHTAKKHESQEICFVTGKRYTDFLDEFYADKFADKSGPILDATGNLLGTHDGIHKYTVGQRKGLAISSSKPYFVKSIDAKTNTLVVDTVEGLVVEAFELNRPNFYVDPSVLSLRDDIEVMVRYRAKTIPAQLKSDSNGKWKVTMQTAAPWVTPGQAAVLYAGDEVLGGGFIGKTLHASREEHCAVASNS